MRLPASSLFPLRVVLAPAPFTLFKASLLLLLVGTSVVGYAQDAKFAAIQTTPTRQIHVMRPAIGLPDSSRLRRPVRPRMQPTPILRTANTGSGIVYTCDPNVDAVQAGTCNYLNTTVAGYYNSTFTNANANIYIQYGTTGLGESDQPVNLVTYDDYVAALTSNTNQSPVQVSALSALGTYDASPYDGGSVFVTTALGTTLGFTGLNGLTADGTSFCTPGTSECYDAIITVTNDPESYGFSLYYDNLGGTEPANAYDYYAVVQHETDEVLGTSSCIETGNGPLTDACGTGVPSAVDLFRYSSEGELVLDSSPSTTPGAYFSYDGGTTNGAKGVAGDPKFYNTLNNGDDYADYISSSPCATNEAIQDADGCPGEDKGLTILNDGKSEIAILNAVGFDVPAAAGVQITIATSPANLLVSVDHGVASAAPLVESWVPGSSHTITTTTPQAGTSGVQYVWSSWSDSGAISHSITVPSSAKSYTANFTTQYLLMAVANPANGGTVTPTVGTYYNAGAVANLTASPSSGYVFTSWTGNPITVANSTSASTTVTMSGPETATANFSVSSGGLSVTPTSLTYGTVYQGTTTVKDVTLRNLGSGSVTISSPSISDITGGTSKEYVLSNGCPKSLPASKSCIMKVSFIAGAFYTPQTATLNVNNSLGAQHVSISASVIDPKVKLSATSLSFGTVKVSASSATKSVKLTNSGATPLTVGISITGTDPGDFNQFSYCPSSLNPGGFCTISVSFKPIKKGSRSAKLTITDNAQKRTQSIGLSGTGD
jgi:hypothetical protein